METRSAPSWPAESGGAARGSDTPHWLQADGRCDHSGVPAPGHAMSVISSTCTLSGSSIRNSGSRGK
jgi:hypothetical protein